jgi:hypothetical protein
MTKRYILLLLLFFSLTGKSQEKIPELITDRPDQTESSSVVPFKTLQIESGFIFENDNSSLLKQKLLNVNTTLFRYGLLERLELRLGLAFLSKQTEISTDAIKKVNGFSSLYAGFKIFVVEENGIVPEISFLGGLVLPFTAKEEFKTTNSAPTMRFAFSHTLNERISLGYNLGAEWSGENAVPNYYYSVALGISVSDKTGVFIESYGTVPEVGISNHLADAGFTFLVRPNLQFDVSAGIGLNKTANDYFVGCGLSYRIQR